MAYLIGMAANALPIPGGIGAVDGSLVGMLTIYGAHLSTAAAAVLVYRALALWIPTLVGTVAYILLRRSLRHPLVLASIPNQIR
jgi:glycosyltransferase 2 family protein